MDGGTLYQLRNLINRRNITKDPKKDVAATEEFFLVVVEAHVLAAAMTMFGMKALDDQPSQTRFLPGSSDLNRLQRRKILLLSAHDIVNLIDLDICEQEKERQQEDGVCAYAREVLMLGLFLMELNDSVREGDGHRLVRCWQYLLLLFKSTNHTNYAFEAFNLLAQYHFLLPPRMAEQLIWNRTVNIHGRAGKNVSCDLHMEHLNRDAKNAITGLGSNITEEAVKRVGKSIGETVKIMRNFDKVNKIKVPSSRHSKRSCAKDMNLLIKQLHEDSCVFKKVPGRSHRYFTNFKANPMRGLKSAHINSWMHEQLTRIMMYA